MARYSTKLDDGTWLFADRSREGRCGGSCPACIRPGGDESHTYVQGAATLSWKHDNQAVGKEDAETLLRLHTTNRSDDDRAKIIDVFINGGCP